MSKGWTNTSYDAMLRKAIFELAKVNLGIVVHMDPIEPYTHLSVVHELVRKYLEAAIRVMDVVLTPKQFQQSFLELCRWTRMVNSKALDEQEKRDAYLLRQAKLRAKKKRKP